MPNYRQREGQETPRERPHAMVPVPERTEGVFFPYRGTQNHGVKQPETAEPYEYYEQDQWDTDENGKILDPEPEPEPIPVKVVQDTARERLNWRAIQVPVNDVKSRIVGRHEKRRSVTVRNPGLSQSVYIGADESVSTYTGYQLEQGTSVTLRTTEDIWAVCASGEASVIHVVYEYAVEL